MTHYKKNKTNVFAKSVMIYHISSFKAYLLTKPILSEIISNRPKDPFSLDVVWRTVDLSSRRKQRFRNCQVYIKSVLF